MTQKSVESHLFTKIKRFQNNMLKIKNVDLYFINIFYLLQWKEQLNFSMSQKVMVL